MNDIQVNPFGDTQKFSVIGDGKNIAQILRESNLKLLLHEDVQGGRVFVNDVFR